MRAPGPLRADGVQVRYGELVAVHPATFLVPPGRMLAVTGPSGAGKSSLLWALAGATAHAGSVDVAGVPVAGRTDAAGRGIALAPQGNGLPSFLTAEENVLMPLLAAGIPAADALIRTRAALALLGLEDSANHLVDELSGGQQQRVALARTLAAAPRSCLPTSRPATSTPATGSGSSTRCGPRPRPAPWSSWPPTTRRPRPSWTPRSGSTTAG